MFFLSIASTSWLLTYDFFLRESLKKWMLLEVIDHPVMNILNVCNGVHQALHEVNLNYHLKLSWYGYFVKLSTVLGLLLFFKAKYFNEKTLGKSWCYWIQIEL